MGEVEEEAREGFSHLRSLNVLVYEKEKFECPMQIHVPMLERMVVKHFYINISPQSPTLAPQWLLPHY